MYGHKATKVGESGQAVTGTKRKENLCMGKFVYRIGILLILFLICNDENLIKLL